jgi:hypothetical protein
MVYFIVFKVKEYQHGLKNKTFLKCHKNTLVNKKWRRFCMFDMCGKDFVDMGGTNVLLM